MKHISIIVPKGAAVLSSIVGPFKVFNRVNQYMMESGKSDQPVFEIDLVGITDETQLYDGAFAVRPTRHIDEVKKTDLIIVSTIIGDLPKEIEANRPFVNWIQEQRFQNNAEVASLCVGAFLLAATGLLDGKSCTTHWDAAEIFKTLYPQVNLLSDKIITDDGGIYTSGGAYSFLNLILHLVEKYCGRETALYCSKLFEIEIDRFSQNQFAIFQGQKSHDDEPIHGAQQYIETHFQQKISVDQLAEMFALSRRNFVRRFKKATYNTPLEYIQRVKIEAAKKELESTNQNVGEIMFSVGYNDVKAFRTVFKKHTGMSPADYRNRFNRSMA